MIFYLVKYLVCVDNWKLINVFGEGSDVVCMGVRVRRD